MLTGPATRSRIRSAALRVTRLVWVAATFPLLLLNESFYVLRERTLMHLGATITLPVPITRLRLMRISW